MLKFFTLTHKEIFTNSIILYLNTYIKNMQLITNHSSPALICPETAKKVPIGLRFITSLHNHFVRESALFMSSCLPPQLAWKEVRQVRQARWGSNILEKTIYYKHVTLNGVNNTFL
jgi:hypothetical protein